MVSDNLPAIITCGGSELQHGTPRLVRELETGALVHLVHGKSGRHRGWLGPQEPPGCEPQRVTLWWMQRHIGAVLDRVRDGEVFALYHARQRRVVGYLFYSPPEWLARMDVSLQYTSRTPFGRTIYRDIYPVDIDAVPLPSPARGRVMADA